MFQKLFAKIDEIIENFNEITNFEELTVEVLNLIKQAFIDTFSDDMQKNEELFDKIMEQKGLWKAFGKKMKKALKDKQELLKYLLYIRAILVEFERRFRAQQKDNRRGKEIDKIIEKYAKLIKEVTENKNLDKETIDKEVKKLQLAMQKEIKSLSFQLER